MEQLIGNHRIAFVEFTTQDGEWIGDSLWMFNDGEVGVLAKLKDTDITRQFVVHVEPKKQIGKLVWSDVLVKKVLGIEPSGVYKLDPKSHSSSTTMRYHTKESCIII